MTDWIDDIRLLRANRAAIAHARSLTQSTERQINFLLRRSARRRVCHVGGKMRLSFVQSQRAWKLLPGTTRRSAAAPLPPLIFMSRWLQLTPTWD